MKLWIRAAKTVVKGLLKVLYPVKITGLENIPESGAFMICANHVSMIDPAHLVFNIKRPISFMAKSELFEKKLLGELIGAFGAFPVMRGKADLSAVRRSIEVLKSGEGFGIFPQGTRSGSNSHMELHTGAAMIRQRVPSPVIPVYIDGPYKLFRPTRISIGKTIDLDEFGRKGDSETIAKITKKIDDSIWAMKQL